MNVENVMMHDVQTAEPSTTLVQAARRMVEHDIGFLPVVDGGTLIGVVTDRDMVVRGIAEACNPTRTPVADIMSVEIVCCYVNQDVEEAKRLMAEHNITRLPVIDDGHGLVGVVSTSNIDGGGAARKKSVGVTFHKEKTDAYGRPHKVALKTIYITGKPSREEAVEAAVNRFEAEQGAGSWRNAASSFDVDEEAPPAPPNKP